MKLFSTLFKHTSIPDGASGTVGLNRRWSAFGLCLLILWILIFVIAPHYEKSKYIKPLAQYIEESGIDAGAIYYTEVDEVAEADLMIRDTFRFYLEEK